MILAQLTPEMVKGSSGFIIYGGAAVWIVVQLATLWVMFRRQPPNEQLKSSLDELSRRVEMVEATIVGKEWFANVDRDLTEIKEDLKRDRSENENHISMRASKIYTTINEVSTELRGEISELRKSFDGRLDDLPERILNMLEKVKALGGRK